MATASRVLPVNSGRAGGGTANDTVPRAAVQSITMSMRFGDKNVSIGYIKKFSWKVTRDNTTLHQIEAYADGTFSVTDKTTNVTTQESRYLNASYFPGEAMEVIPGKQPAIDIDIDRYCLYTSSLLSALDLYKAGTEYNGATDFANYNGQSFSGAFNDGNNNRINYVSLLQQIRSIDITQLYTNPINGNIIFGRVFEECWFKNYGETIPDADKNEAVYESATLTCPRIRPYKVDTDSAVAAASSS